MRKMKKAVLAAAVLLTVAAPALAQQLSEGLTFLKGVRSRDSAAVERVLANPSSTAINARESGSGMGALHILARARDLTWLSYLLGRGARADVQDNQGDTPLHIASFLGWSEGVARLLRARATVDMPNNQGVTPLIAAVQQRHVAVVRLLLARGADPNHTDSAAGYSALDYARRDTRSAEILRLLQAPRTPARPAAGPTR